jgi:hypothetical protein
MSGVKKWRKSLIITLVLATSLAAVLVSCWPPDPDPDPDPDSNIANIDVAKDTSRRFGAPQVAINPKDPNNIIVLASANIGYTLECQETGDPKCELIPQYIDQTAMGTAPRGFYQGDGFCDVGVFVSHDRGKTFKQIDVSQMTPIGHPEINFKGEGPLAATADGPNGTFYIGFNAINWGDWEGNPPSGFPNGGVGVIRSSDKGETWQGAWLSGTPADWPFGTSDVSTGTVYVVSGTPMSTLGKRSTGEPDAEESEIADRWIASSQDGQHWSDPKPLGGAGPNGLRHFSANHSAASAAHGYVTTLFQATSQRACEAFVGKEAAMPCIIFQVSDDEGKTWARHRMPVPDGFRPGGMTGLMPAADPKKAGHFAAVLMNQGATQFSVYVTEDFGKTWSGPTVVTDNSSKVHWGSWAAYSPDGVLGLMWKTNEPKPAGSQTANAPYSVWAAISKDGGKTFSKPLKVSRQNSPAPPAKERNDYWNGHVGDHGPSGMTLDGTTAYVAWGDWTPGERTIMFAAVDFGQFKF